MPERVVPPSVAALLQQRRGAEPNAIATYQPQQPLDTIKATEVLDVSWSEVRRVLDETIVAITHEGGLEDVQVSEAVLLVSVALRDLAAEEELVRRALERVPKNNIFTYLQAVLPGRIGLAARTDITKRWKTEKDSAEVTKIVADMKELRLSLADAIDTGIHNKLMETDASYRALQERGWKIHEDQDPAQGILDEVKEYIRIKRLSSDEKYVYRIKNKPQSPNWESFYRSRDCQPQLSKTAATPEELVVGLIAYVARCENQLTDLRAQMKHRRDVEKEKIYNNRTKSWV